MWNTYLNPITLSDDSLPASPEIYSEEPKNGSVRLELQTNSTATSYQVKYGTTPGTYTNTISSISSSPYSVTGLTNRTKYYFVVDAVNSSGTSNDGSAVSATPQNYTLLTLSGATASSYYPAGPPSNAIDGSMTTNYYSQLYSDNGNHTEWIYADAGSNQSIGRLVITSRQKDLLAAPQYGKNVQIQVSNDATNWFSVPDYYLGQYGIIDDDGYAKTVIDFREPISARYVHLYATKLSTDNYGIYALEIAELQAYSTPEVAIASSYYTGWDPYRMLDLDDVNTLYSSALHTSAGYTEYAGVNLGSSQTVTGINITPRAGNAVRLRKGEHKLPQINEKAGILSMIKSTLFGFRRNQMTAGQTFFLLLL